uniref:Replication protein A subunit n=1 Tax=Anthurium amnicola TaxID=1678845 RepID=A0A1D1XHA3_9ARAE
MEGVSLTRGAIADITNGGAEGMKPVLQVVDLKLVQTVQNTTERFRMVLSDGVHAQQAMLATQMNTMVKSGQLQKGSVVQLNEFICNLIQNRKIIIVLSLEVILEQCNTIGEPRIYDAGSATSQGRPSPPSSSADKPGTTAGGPQSNDCSLALGGNMAILSATGVNNLRPKTEAMMNNSPYGGLSSAGINLGQNLPNVGASLSHRTEPEPRTYAEAPQNLNHNQRFSNPGSMGALQPPISNYGRSVQSTYHQPPPMYTNRGPIAKNEAPPRIVPIAALNPYQGRWTIKARVTSKGDLRRYNNPRGEGKVFSFDLLDSDGGEIRVTCFNSVADQFFDQIEAGKVYLISRGSLKPVLQKSFNHLNNEYEIFLESTSTIQPCLDEDDSIPHVQFNFRSIGEIEGIENNSVVDVIGLVSSINPATTILRKNGTETVKRALQLKDMSGRSVELTLWGNFCNAEGQKLQEMCDSGVSPVLAIKSGRVSDFSGKSVGTISSSQLFIDPDLPEAQRLRQWFDREGKNSAAVSISRDSLNMGRMDARKTISQIKDDGLGRSEKPDWITVRATVTFIKVDNFCYTACPLMVGDRPCNKKVNNNGDGTWRCDRCDQSFPECEYRYLLQLQIQDHTGLTWVTAFQESGEEIIGVTAKELYLLKYEEQDDVKFAEIIRKVLFNEYLFKLKVKEETFSDEQRVKSTVVKAEKVNPSTECRYLLNLIEKLSVGGPSIVSGRTESVPSEAGRSNAGYGSVDVKPGMFSVGNTPRSNSNVHMHQMEAPKPMGQYMNAYGSNAGHTAGTRIMQAVCNNCGSVGHTPQNCPRVMRGLDQPIGAGYVGRTSNMPVDNGNAASGNCFKCQQPGHWARDCPGTSGLPTYGKNNMTGRYGFSKQELGGY